MNRVAACSAALLLPLLLTACAPAVRMPGDAGLLAAQREREHTLSGAEHWSLQGRLGVSDGRDGGSGSFSWTQDGERYEFVLRAPAAMRTMPCSRAWMAGRCAAPMPRR